MQPKLRFGLLAIGLAAVLGSPACSGDPQIIRHSGSAGTGQVGGSGGNQGTGEVTGSVAGTSGSAGSAGNDGTAGTGIGPGTAGTGGSTGNGPGDGGTSGAAGVSDTGGGGGGGTTGRGGTTGTAGAAGSSRGGTTGTAGTTGTGGTGPIQVLIWNNALAYGHAARVGAINLLKAREATDNIKFDTTYAHTGNVSEGASDTTFDASVFTDANLDKYDVVFFLDTTGTTIDDSQKTVRRQALQDFIEKKGRGYVGTHSATDTYQSGTWAWYVNFVGANFDNHSGADTSGTATWYNNTSHPILTAAGTPNPWNRKEEWYTFKSKPESIAGVTLLLTCHDTQMTQERPTAWVHEMPVMAPATRGGRMFYTAFGHYTAAFQEKQVMDLIIAGIKWAAYRL